MYVSVIATGMVTFLCLGDRCSRIVGWLEGRVATAATHACPDSKPTIVEMLHRRKTQHTASTGMKEKWITGHDK
jgi:hypothetical protein